MKKSALQISAVVLALGALSVQAQVTLTPLSTFGGGDGWLSPGEGGYTYLTTGNTERGLAYGNGHVYLVSRASGNQIRILDPLTGADLGGLNNAGITGGANAVNTIGVGGDGAIYVNNLTTQSTTSPLKIYKWATEGSVASVAYSGDAGLAGSRVGDSLAAIGSGASTRLALGYGSTPAVAGNNSYVIIDPTASTATAVTLAGSPPAAGDFRLGITFSDSSHVLGTQGSSLYRYTSFAGGTGTLLASPAIPDPAGATADRLMAYTVLNGLSLLAMQSIGDSHVSLYDVSNPATPVWLVSGNNTSGPLTANGNGTGQIAWGDVTDLGGGIFQQTLYAMSSNQGIQAFIVQVPEPGSFAFAALGLGALVAIRRFRK
jgi:hypothetical protein